jgi:UDP-GlcNAc3NAcA epimerase
LKPIQPSIEKENLTQPFVLATLHRAENTNDSKRLIQICQAFNEINQKVKVVLPLHPRTKSFLANQNIQLNAHIIDPVGYFDMLALLKNCKMVLTDSGGLQKEAYFFEKFCITLRDQTEWIELIEAGANALAGADRKKIISLFDENIDKTVKLKEGLYGNGNAASIIAKHFS